MKKRTKKKPVKKGANTPLLGMIVCIFLLGLTLIRLSIATSGSLTESEAMLSLCADHPDAAYLEGPAGPPLLIAFKDLLFGSAETSSGFIAMRCISPLAALLLSWCVWWIGRSLLPQQPGFALWAMLGVNLLPTLNLATLVMNGAVVMASILLLCVVAAWNAVQTRGSKELLAWILFGAALALGTFFYYPVGILFPIAVTLRLIFQGIKPFPWQTFLLSPLLLVAAWIPPLLWNLRHDWLQWGSVASGFDTIRFADISFPLGLVTALSAALVPLLLLVTSTLWWRGILLFLALLMAGASTWVLLASQKLSPGLPSPVGIRGLENLSNHILTLRDQRIDSKISEERPFLIASTPQLAALLHAHIHLTYPECPSAPSVFALESPSMNSSFSIWPGYADAVVAASKDILYSEEKFVSPFLEHNALYITPESQRELPQSITGAFTSIKLLQEIPITQNGQPITMHIYQCVGYKALSL